MKWFVQPWPDLDQDLFDQGYTIRDMPVFGVSVNTAGDVFATGRFGIRSADSGTTVYSGIAAKLSGVDGSVIGVTQYPELNRMMTNAVDPSDDVMFVSGMITKKPTEVGALGIPLFKEGTFEEGHTLSCISTVDGTVYWTRYAPGTEIEEDPSGRLELEHGNVHLGVESDSDYVYVSYMGVGSLGPTTLDYGTFYGGCKAADGTITPEWEFDGVGPYNPNCPSGEYVPRVIPSSAANSDAICSGYNGATNCVVKYHKRTGLPVWGSAQPMIYGFSPRGDGIAVAGSNRGPAAFDSVNVAGPLNGDDDMVWQSEIDLDGKGVYVQPVTADRAWVAGGGITTDGATGDLFMTMRTTSTRTYLGPGAPGGFTLELEYGNCDDSKYVCENPRGQDHLIVAKLGANQLPACLSSDTSIKSGYCFIDNVCYSSGDTGRSLGAASASCTPGTSQEAWTFVTDSPTKAPTPAEVVATKAPTPTKVETKSPVKAPPAAAETSDGNQLSMGGIALWSTLLFVLA